VGEQRSGAGLENPPHIDPGSTGGIETIAPEAALRPGSFDPFALLVVWCARKSFYGILWLGLTIVALTGKLNDVSIDIDALASDLRSPLAVVWLAVAVRVGAAGAGLALAYRIARQHQGNYSYRAGPSGWIDVGFDGWQLTRSLCSFRWTYPVRAAAIGRLGSAGVRLRVLGSVVNVLNNVLLAVLVVVVVVSN
jgi:hypothetical protein